MASNLEVQPVLDARLLTENPSQIVSIGANQAIMRRFPASTVNASSISWQNLLSIGAGTLVDTRAFIEYDLAITVTTATAAGGGAPYKFPGVSADFTQIAPINVVGGAVYPTVGFTQYPLHSVAQNAEITINNVSQGFTCNQLFAVVKEWILDEDQRANVATSCPAENSVSAVSQASAAGAIVPDQPLTPAFACAGRSRASYQPISVAVVGPNTIITYRFREPVLVPPMGLHNSPALGNVESFGLAYNLDSSSQLRNMLCSSLAAAANNIVASLGVAFSIAPTAASLYLTFLTPPLDITPIPPVCSYSYNFPQLQSTQIANSLDAVPPAAYNSTSSMTTTSQRLTTVPQLYACKLGYNVIGRNEQNSNGAGLRIISVQINYGNFGTYSLSQQEIWELYTKNAPKSGLTHQAWLNMGCPVLINPTLDLTGANVFAGMSNDAALMWSNTITYTAANYADFGSFANAGIGTPATQFYAYEVFIQNGSVSIGGGSCVFKQTSASQSAVVQALQQKDVPTDQALKSGDSVDGAGLFSTLKSVFHHAKKHAGTVAKVLPIAQAGLEALAGSGASGGAMNYRRRR